MAILYLMQDGAPAHRAKHTQAKVKKLGIIRLEWLASSPDLNPIETLWRTMKRRLSNLSTRPTTVPQMVTALQTMFVELNSQTDTLPHILCLYLLVLGLLLQLMVDIHGFSFMYLIKFLFLYFPTVWTCMFASNCTSLLYFKV